MSFWHSPTRSQVDFCFTSSQSASALLVREVLRPYAIAGGSFAFLIARLRNVLWTLLECRRVVAFSSNSFVFIIVGFTFSEAAATLRDCRRVVALLLWLT